MGIAEIETSIIRQPLSSTFAPRQVFYVRSLLLKNALNLTKATLIKTNFEEIMNFCHSNNQKSA